MNVQKPSPSPATGETRLLIQALAGDIHAVDKLLQYLGSSNPNIRKIMLDSILSFNQLKLYHHLLVCLAQGEWEIQTTRQQILVPPALLAACCQPGSKLRPRKASG